MSKWTDFVKDWAAKNNTTYGCALSNPKCSADYRKENPTKKELKAKEAQAEADKRKQMIADEEVRRKAKKEAKAEAERLVAEEKKRLAEEEKRLADEARKLELEKKRLEEEAKKKEEAPVKITVKRIKIGDTEYLVNVSNGDAYDSKTKEYVGFYNKEKNIIEEGEEDEEDPKKKEARLRQSILKLPTELKQNILGFVDRSISKADLERLIEIHQDLDYQKVKFDMIDVVDMPIPKYAKEDAKDIIEDEIIGVMRVINDIFELSGNQDIRDKAEEDGNWYYDYGNIDFQDEADVGLSGEKFDSARFKNYIKKAYNWVREWGREVNKIGKNVLPPLLSSNVVKARAKAKAENEKKAEQAKPAKPFEISSTKIGGSSGWKKNYTEDEIKLIEASAERAKTRTRIANRADKSLPIQSEVDEAIAKKYGLAKTWTKKAEKLLSSIREKNGLSSGVNYQDVAVRIVEGKIEGGMMRLPSGINMNEINDYLTIPSQEEQDQSMSGMKRRRDDAKTALKNKITRLLGRVALIELNPRKRNIDNIRATKQKLGDILEEIDRLGIREIEDQMEEVDKMDREISGGMIYGGVLSMTDAQGNPLPPELRRKNGLINRLNQSYDLLANQLVDLIDANNPDALADLEDINDGMNTLRDDLITLEDQREAMPMNEFQRETKRLFNTLTRYFREAQRMEGNPPPDEGETDVEGFGIGKSRPVAPEPEPEPKPKPKPKQFTKGKFPKKISVRPKLNRIIDMATPEDELLFEQPSNYKRNKYLGDMGKMEGSGMRSSDTCFTEKEVQDSLKKMAEWVKEEPVEPTRNEITAKAKAEITLLKSKKRGFDKAKKSTKPYAYEREAHQQAIKEAYPRGRGLTKGSQEAKDWGAKMRAMRGKRSAKPTHKKTAKCCKMCAGKGCYCCE